MRLRPRQYVLIALILLVGAFNLYRVHRLRAKATALAPAPAVVALAPAPPASSAAWSAFDAAAALRDAPDAQFQPALSTLNQKPDAATGDIFGCKTWLLFYRQNLLHPSRDQDWKLRSERHLKGCTTQHQDTSA
jgi:hypothetical protein